MKLCGFDIGLDKPIFLMAGPCVLEGELMALDIAHTMKEITSKLGIHYIFKASYDKANRTSETAFRGLGMDEGLRILARVREEVGVPVVTACTPPKKCPWWQASWMCSRRLPSFAVRRTLSTPVRARVSP